MQLARTAQNLSPKRLNHSLKQLGKKLKSQLGMILYYHLEWVELHSEVRTINNGSILRKSKDPA